MNQVKKIIENIIFGSRWLLIPFYLILIMALTVYTWFDIKEFAEYILHLGVIDKEKAMLTFVELIDITMIANLGKMIITGSYHSFVSKEHGEEGEKVSSGMLKVKTATSMVGVTAIALLKQSVEVGGVSWDTLNKLAYVHGVFLGSAIILAIVDYMHVKGERIEVDTEEKQEQHHHQVNGHEIYKNIHQDAPGGKQVLNQSH